jgi:hypothetical protein
MPNNPTVRVLFSFSAAIVLAAVLFKIVATHDRYVSESQWYLLEPPSVGRDFRQTDQGAPLSKWWIEESYASRERCEKARGILQAGRCVAANVRGIPHSDYFWDAHPEYLIDRDPPSNSLSRLLNHVAANSRTDPGELGSRLFDYWAPLLFVALFAYYPIDLVVGVYRGEASRKRGAELADALVAVECLAVGFVLASSISVAMFEGLILPVDRYLAYLTARGLGLVAWVGFPIALVLFIAVVFRPIAIVLRPIARWLEFFLARLDELLPPSRSLTRATRWWSMLALAAAGVTFAGQESGGSPEAVWNLRWLWVLAALASPLWPLSQVVERRLKALNPVPPARSPTIRCDQCKSDLRRSFRCCNQRLCTDCFIDHVSAGSGHEPPLADSALAFATFFDTSNPEVARAAKMLCVHSHTDRNDLWGLSDALADIDNIKFTSCQKCNRTLRHFFVESEKVLCTDCFLDHGAEIANGSARPSSQP